MKKLSLAIIIFLSLSCSNSDKQIKKDLISRNNLSDSANIADSLVNNLIYIGFLDTFEFSKKNEAFVELYFKVDNIDYDKISKLADSLVFENDDYSRYRLPLNHAEKYFDLSSLSEVKVFDTLNRFVCDADFVRVEYLNGPVSSRFVAVYNSEKNIKKGTYFCISNLDEKFNPINFSVLSDTTLTKNILRKLKVPMSYSGLKRSGTHLFFQASKNVISLVNSDLNSFIVLKNGKKTKILYRSTEEENIIDFRVIRLLNSDFPLILTRNNQPDTDVLWDNLLCFDGKKYDISPGQRIKKRVLTQP